MVRLCVLVGEADVRYGCKPYDGTPYQRHNCRDPRLYRCVRLKLIEGHLSLTGCLSKIPNTRELESITGIQTCMPWLVLQCLVIFCVQFLCMQGLTMLQVLTGRPSVRWGSNGATVHLTDFCEDHDDNVAVIMDPCAEWAEEVADRLQVPLTLCPQSS